MPVHPTAIVDASAQIDPTAEIGPFVVVEGPVVVGRGTRIMAHAVLKGHVTLGRDNVVHPGAVIGDVPQDLGYGGGESFVRIGDRNVFREHTQVHRGTKPGSETVLGNDNFLMTNAHVAHNCKLGDKVVLATGATLGGYVEVGDQAFISGNCVVHQFVRVGRLAILRGLSRTSRDVPPFCVMDGTHTVRGINRVGLRRAGFSPERIRCLQRAYVTLFRSRRNLAVALQELENQPCSEEVQELIAFIRQSRRGVCMGPRQANAGDDSVVA
jgi:UDP-N-acetylglucosamine acyltransferase